MLSLRSAALCVFVMVAAAASAQLKIGDGGIVGVHSDHRVRDYYITSAIGGGFQSGAGLRSPIVALRVTIGAGRTWRLSDRFYLGGEIRVGGGQDFETEGFRGIGAGSFEGTLLGAAFLSAGERGRSWFKIGLPVLSASPLLSDQSAGGINRYLPHTAAASWIYYFRRDRDAAYVRPEALRGGGGLRGFSVDARAGQLFLATGLAPRLTYALGRWEAGVGTFVHAGGVGRFEEGLRFGADYLPLTVSGGYALRRTADARLQLMAEVLAPLGVAGEIEEFRRAYFAVYVRYEHRLADRLAAAVEIGPNFMRNVSDGFSETNSFLHGTVGLRYGL